MKPVAIVTGANSGIGKEVAAGLLDKDYKVIMACRREDSCDTARSALLEQYPNASCECHHLDLSNYQSIRDFSAQILKEHQLVHILVNNAGVMNPPPPSPPDNNTDPHLLPNHYGPFILTRLLMPSMAKHGRIVTVGSNAHYRGNVNFTLQPTESQAETLSLSQPPWHWYLQYARSKLMNALMTAELTRRLQARNSTVTTCCGSPGRVNTAIFKNSTLLNNRISSSLLSRFFQTPQQGARTILHAAVGMEKLEGKYMPLYLHDMKEKEPSTQAQDAVVAEKLWDLSVQETGLSVEEDGALWPRH